MKQEEFELKYYIGNRSINKYFACVNLLEAVLRSSTYLSTVTNHEAIHTVNIRKTGKIIKV